MRSNYEPEKYWSERARKSQGDVLQAVCIDKVPEVENRSAGLMQIKLMKHALKYANAPKNARILEYGCGAGRWYNFFHDQGYEWFGVDISSEMLSLASKKCEKNKLDKTDGTNIPHEDSSFDIIYSVTVLHHNSYESQDKIIAEMLRVLKPGGSLILYEDLDIGAQSFNMFPRSVEGWVATAEKYGVTSVYHDEVKYWPFRSVLYKLIGGTVSEANKDSWLRKVVGWLDLCLGGYVQVLIPKEKMLASVMVFRKETM